MIFRGPNSLSAPFGEFYSHCQNLFISEALELKNRKAVLGTEFGHFIVSVVTESNDRAPALSLFIDEEGRGFLGLSSENPLKRMSAIYRYQPSKATGLLREFYSHLFPEAEISLSRVILQSPLRIHFVVFGGNERLLKREMLKASLSGKGFYRIAEKMGDELFDFYCKYYRKWLKLRKGEVFIYPTEDIVKIVTGRPRLNYSVDLSIVIELSRLFRNLVVKKHKFLRPSNISPDMNFSGVATSVYEVDLVDSLGVYQKLNPFYDMYSKSIERTIEAMMNSIKKLPFGEVLNDD